MASKKDANVERRSGKDRRSGADTRTEEEKQVVGERRSRTDRRSGPNHNPILLQQRAAFRKTFSYRDSDGAG